MNKLSYTFKEAAEATGYSTDVIRREVAKGNLAARYANTKPVILADELNSWLNALPAEAPTK